MKTLTVPAEAAGQRLDLWLVSELDYPRSHVQRLIRDGLVTHIGQPVRASLKLHGGEVVEVELPSVKPVAPTNLDLPVIYQDDDIVVINKPAGLTVHPASTHSGEATVVDFARRYTTDADVERPGIVHRLDRDTSGLLILARTATAKAALQDEFRQHRVTKTYLALVVGRLRPEAAVIRLPLARSANDPLKRVPTPGGKAAETTYRVVEEFDGFSLIEAKPKTGRTHQIRAHLAAVGHPIAGDYRYGAMAVPDGLKRQFLHATSLELKLPSGETKRFEAPLAPDLAKVLKNLH